MTKRETTGWEPTRHGGLRRTDGGSSRRAAGRFPAGQWFDSLPPCFKKEPLGIPECPYAIRWKLETKHWSIRLHHWLAPDDPRAPHDHPWNFLTVVLRGGYTDVSPDSADEHLRAPTIRYRSRFHRHTVVPDPGGAWTLVFTGAKLRPWGFWSDGKFFKANKWFASRGHHPCN